MTGSGRFGSMWKNSVDADIFRANSSEIYRMYTAWRVTLFHDGYVEDCRKKYPEIMKTVIAFLSLFCYTILGQTRVSGRIILAGEVAVPCTCNPL